MALLARHNALRALVAPATPALRRAAWGAPDLSQIPGVPLNVPLYDETPAPAPEGLIPNPVTRMTTLPNGLKVVSQADATPVATVGVVVNTGSRYETAENSGASYMLQLMAFTSTASRTHFKMVRDLESMGAQTAASAGREQITYTVSGLKANVKDMLDVVAETTLEGSFVEWELDEKKAFYAEEVKDLAANPLQYVTEKCHVAAYAGQGLGMPLMCAPGKLGKLTAPVLGQFMETYFSPANMVLAAVGPDHDELCKAAEAAFGTVPAGSAAPPPPKAAYTGGDFREVSDSEVTHFGLAVEGVGWNDPDFVPLCVLNMLMGGGASFSAGGPGKGMFSRLYLNVLNKYPYALNAAVFNSVHSDSGIFGVHGTAEPAHVGSLATVLVEELAAMGSKPFSGEEVSRAKNQLTSSLFMNLESSAILWEDLGRQVATSGKRTSPEDLAKQIAAVTPEKLSEVAKRLLKSPPTVVVYGDTTAVPRYDLIAKNLA